MRWRDINSQVVVLLDTRYKCDTNNSITTTVKMIMMMNANSRNVLIRSHSFHSVSVPNPDLHIRAIIFRNIIDIRHCAIINYAE